MAVVILPQVHEDEKKKNTSQLLTEAQVTFLQHKELR